MSVTVMVADTGEGIAPEHLLHVGERFHQVDAARSGGTEVAASDTHDGCDCFLRKEFVR